MNLTMDLRRIASPSHLHRAMTCVSILAALAAVGRAEDRSVRVATAPVTPSDQAALVTGTVTRLQSQIAGGIGGARIELVPIPAKVGMYPVNTVIVDQEIIIDSLPTTTRLWFEFKLSGWDPDGDDRLDGTGVCTTGTCTAGTVGASCTIDMDCDRPTLALFNTELVGSGFFDADLDLNGNLADDGDQVNIYPAVQQCSAANSTGNAECTASLGEPGSQCENGSFHPLCPSAFCCQPMFSTPSNPRPDALWAGVDSAAYGVTDSPVFNYRLLAAAEAPAFFHDDGTMKYGGTLIVDVPPGALGRYTIPLNPAATLFLDRQSPGEDIPLAELSGTMIRIRGCTSNAQCNDADACTSDQCNIPFGLCSHALLAAFDPLTECCDSASGNVLAQADSDPSTCDACSLPESRGTPTHTPCDDADACTANFCSTTTGQCNFPLVSSFDPQTKCCDSASGNIAARDDGDVCTADLCSLPNSRGIPSHPPMPDTTACDDFLTCTLDDHCDGVLSQEDGGCIGTPIASLSCGTPTDCESLTGTAFPCVGGFCDCTELPRINWDANPLSSTRASRTLTMSLTAPAATGGEGPAALQIEMVDLQHPNPNNRPTVSPPDFTAFDTANNGVCSGATAAPNYNGHHCDVDADCICAPPTCGPFNSISTDDGTCGSLLGCALADGCVRWVGSVTTFREKQGVPGLGTYRAARLQCTPYYTDWTALGPFSVFGAEIVPSSTYHAMIFGTSCQGEESSCAYVSSPVTMLTRRSGDVAPAWNPGTLPPSLQPDANDIGAMLDKFKGAPGSPSNMAALIVGNPPDPNTDVGGQEIVEAVSTYWGQRYPFSGPCACPSTVTCGATACSSTNSAPCGAGLCVITCVGGINAGLPCKDYPPNAPADHCPGGTCPTDGFCRDRCGRCN